VPPVRQTNFSAGELDPLLHGRTDLALYSKGAKTVRNFVPLKNGSLMTRPGSTHVAVVKTIAAYTGLAAGAEPDRPVRLERFVFSDTDSCVLELGEKYVRFHALGRTIEKPAGTTYEITQYTDRNGVVQPLPWAATQIWKLNFAQVGNILFVVGEGYPPLELRRNAQNDWTATETSFSPPAPAMPDVGSSAMPDPFNPGTGPIQALTTPFMLKRPLPGAGAGEPLREWRWGFTAIMRRLSDGLILESAFTEVKYSTDGIETFVGPGTPPDQQLLADNQVAVYPDKPVTLVRLFNANGTPPDFQTLAFRLYRGRGDVFGWVGDTRTHEFVDQGDEPDYTIQPPLGTDPFRRIIGGLAFIERPLAVGFFQQRRVFGGGSIITARTLIGGVWTGGDNIGRVDTLFFSATNDFYNFDQRLALHIAGEPLTFQLAARRREFIRHLVPMDRLVVLTNCSSWTIGGQTGSPLDFDSVDARVCDDVGSGYVRPLIVDGCVLFVRTKGTGARVLVPASSDTPYRGLDVSENARHLFVGKDRQIVDWAYQEDPFGLIWAVRADGTLLSFTFDRGHEVTAWAHHDSEPGSATYESVCTVPEGDEDAVYVVVKRFIKGDAGGQDLEAVRCIERFTSRVRRIKETDPNPTVVAVPSVDDVDTLFPTDVCVDAAIRYRGPPTLTFTGLDRHAFKEVYVVARGMSVEKGTVDADGNLTLNLPAAPAANAVDENGQPIFVAHIGLAFTCDFESLAHYGGSTLQQRTVSEICFELDEARGVKAGQSLTKLTVWKQRAVSDAFGAISAATTLLQTPVTNAWDKTARVCLRQELPLPVTVVGITREVV
jgi:hypothetical protein